MKTPLQEWFKAHLDQDPKLRWLDAMKSQVVYVRDDLAYLVGGNREDTAFAIGEHRSKSVVLPVYLLERADIGLQFYLRNNFYNWKLSVVSERPTEADFSGLFMTEPPPDPTYTGDPLRAVYFEGFPRELVFGYYGPSDKRRWSAEIGGDSRLWTTLFLIMRSIGAIEPRKWNRREVLT